MPTFPTASTSDEKLRELIVYIALKSEKDPRCGAVKLNKLLFYADFIAYRQLGEPITGAEYQHLGEGPAPRRLLPARESLLAEDAIKIEYRSTITAQPLQQIIAKREAKTKGLFTKEQLRLVDHIVKAFWEHTGTQLSELSHEEFGWKLTKEGETIPYRTAWLSSEPPTVEQIEVGKKIAKKYGLAR